jgi:hypothetical protein
MHTHITKQNVRAAIRDDKAHMDYLKRDVKDDQRAGGKYKDENQTADEKHITHLAEDVRYDEKKEGISRKNPRGGEVKSGTEADKTKKKDLMEYNPVVDRAGWVEKKEGQGSGRPSKELKNTGRPAPMSRKVSEKRAKNMVAKGKGVMDYAIGGIGEEHNPGGAKNRGQFTKIKRKHRTGEEKTSYFGSELGKSMDIR